MKIVLFFLFIILNSFSLISQKIIKEGLKFDKLKFELSSLQEDELLEFINSLSVVDELELSLYSKVDTKKDVKKYLAKVTQKRAKQVTDFLIENTNITINNIDVHYIRSSKTIANSNGHYKEFVYQKLSPVKLFIRKPVDFKLNDIFLDTSINSDSLVIVETFNKEDYRINYIPPEDSCRAFFSGALVYDSAINRCTSKYFVEDKFSSYVGSGDYPDCSRAFPKAHRQTFDGLVIDVGTKVIIFKEKNFLGDTLLVIQGPIIINNILFKDVVNGALPVDWIDKKMEPLLNDKFPPKNRVWSTTNMHTWSNGSMRIICDK